MKLPDLIILADGRRVERDETLLPLLTAYTREDADAKGLRKFQEDETEPRRPVHYTALELVSMFPRLLLHAPDGGGKSTFARELAASINGNTFEHTVLNGERLLRPAYRNCDDDLEAQHVHLDVTRAVLTNAVYATESLAPDFAIGTSERVILIVDALQENQNPEAFLVALLKLAEDNAQIRILVLCESEALAGIRRPSDLPSYRIIGLSRREREDFTSRTGVYDPLGDDDYVLPGLWYLSLVNDRRVQPDKVGDLCNEDWTCAYRQASDLSRMDPLQLQEAMPKNESVFSLPFSMMCRWLALDGRDHGELIRRLISEKQDLRQILSLAFLCTPGSAEADLVTQVLVDAIAAGGTAAGLRFQAGEALARLGDPRDLENMVTVPAGSYRMGGDLHPNSEPGHQVSVDAFRIGTYLVTNAAYGRFVHDTNRRWPSVNGLDPDRSSHPATDVTWQDARAYCDWLSRKWRGDGRISETEFVRLPTEREWEAAARGPQGLLYPWGAEWAPEHANGLETDHNDICTVGLFPEGCSPFGCFDMAGQAWEWCTTLWGSDMTKPSFKYPWQDDGREEMSAAGNVRRILRGGCFSSPSSKANGVYRGSLEPSGFWRGNSFRIVVSRNVAI